jgi:hypothetical protein
MNMRRTTTKFDCIIGDSLMIQNGIVSFISNLFPFHILQPDALNTEVG